MTVLLKVSAFRLSPFKNDLEQLTAYLIVFFVFLTVNKTTRLHVHLHYYADVTSEGNIPVEGNLTGVPDDLSPSTLPSLDQSKFTIT